MVNRAADEFPSAESTREMLAIVRNDESGRMRTATVALPAPGDGEVLIEIRAAGVVDADTHVRSGAEHMAEAVAGFLRRGPVTTGIEFAGIVASDGRSFRRGDRVFGYVHLLEGPRVHAAFAAVPEAAMSAMPPGISFVEAASLPTGGLTAMEILTPFPDLGSRHSILVIGAAGSVGGHVVQLAAARAAHVVAVASESRAEEMRSIGAAEVRVDRDRPFRDDDRFDLIVDTPARWTFAEALPFLRRRGTYVTTDPLADEAGFAVAEETTQTAGYLMMLDTTTERLTQLRDLVTAGILTPRVDSVFSPGDVERAFDRCLARGKRGRVVLDLSPDDVPRAH